MWKLLIFLLLFCWSEAFAQRRIEGELKTTAGVPVSHASVLLKHPSNRILAYGPSDAKGYFELRIPDTVKWSDLRIEINHLGYARVNIPLVAGKTRYDILLEEKAIDLTEIEVKNRPRIEAKGDTLSYDVGSFARAEDRNIGDVLKRMPGMEVSESGQIKYNDKPISNFYIDGEDLLDDKYAIGTKTIPHAMVQKLEVLQNYQPMKVLRHKTLSDKVAINLVIKDEAKLKLTGQAKLGAGFPHQYDGELNTILFNKKYKMLNVAKGNNIGVDLSSDFTSFGLGGAGNPKPAALLSAGIGGVPNLSKNRYYLNNSGSLNANNLVNLKNGLQLKSNLHAMIDRNELGSYSRSEVYLGHDTIRYEEQQSIEKNPFLTELTLNAQSNKDTYYFNNALKLNYRGDRGESNLTSHTLEFDQSLRHRIRDFSNTLEYVPQLTNRGILNLNWYLNYYNQPENLSLRPGFNADLLNAGIPFAGAQQFTEVPTWFNRFSLTYRLPKGKIMQFYRVSTLHEFQQLHSRLRLQQDDGSIQAYAGSEDNTLDWKRNELTVAGSYEYKQGRMEAALNLPLTAQHIRYQDPLFDLDKMRTRVLFSPNFRGKMMTTAEDYISVSYSYGENTGNVNGVFRGAVLTNYRTLRANDADLQETRSHNGSLHYNFQRSISMLFMNAGINYSKSMANAIAGSIMTDEISRVVWIPFDHDVSSFRASAGISKYIFALGATASLKGSWSTSRSNQLINGEPLPFRNVSWSLAPGAEARLWKEVSLTYEGTGTWTVSKKAGEMNGQTPFDQPDRQIKQFDQSLGLNYSPMRALFLRVNGRHQYVEQPGMERLRYLFLDAKVRYTLIRQRIDFDLDLTNLANVRRYETFSLTANQFGYSLYHLRGRMAVMKLTFNL